MWTGGAGDQSTDLLIGGQLALPPEPHPPKINENINYILLSILVLMHQLSKLGHPYPIKGYPIKG